MPIITRGARCAAIDDERDVEEARRRLLFILHFTTAGAPLLPARHAITREGLELDGDETIHFDGRHATSFGRPVNASTHEKKRDGSGAELPGPAHHEAPDVDAVARRADAPRRMPRSRKRFS